MDSSALSSLFIEKPGAPSIVSSEEGIQASSLTLRWTPPADDGGSPITGYRVIIVKGDTEINRVNISDPGRTSYTFGGLERDTNYTVKVFVRSAIFEGDPVVITVTTKVEGPPAAVGIYDLPSETTDDEITLKWKEPEDNGREITQYTVYQRLVTNRKVGEWRVVRKIAEVSIKELMVKMEKAQEECKCSCHDVIFIAIIGVLLVLFTYILWLNQKGAGRTRRVYKDDGTYENDMKLNDLELSCLESSDFAQHPAEYMDIKETSLDDIQAQAAGKVANYAALHTSTRSWEVSRDHVTIEKIIGKGAFGQVAKGMVVNPRGRPGRTTIAIKMLKDEASELDTRDLLNELETMKQLEPHPRVIKLPGCVTETETDQHENVRQAVVRKL